MKCPDENWLRISIEASRQLVEKLLEYDPQAELIPTPRAAALQQQVDDLALRWYRDIDTRERAPFVGWPEEIASAGHACSKCFLELHKAWIDREQPATFGLPYFSPSIIPATSEAESTAPEMVRSTRPLRELAERFSGAIERLEKLTLGPPPPSAELDPQTCRLYISSRDQAIILEDSATTVLTVIIGLGGAATLKELRNATGTDKPHQTLRDAVNKTPELQQFVQFPGGKGKGGYRTTLKLRPPQ